MSAQSIALVLLLLVGCSSGTGSKPPATNAARQALLQESSACIQAEVLAFRDQAAALTRAFDGGNPREVWAQTVVKWELLEAMQVGPAAAVIGAGGEGLRDGVYSWPLVGRCAVEETLVSMAYATGVSGLTVNRKTLAALELLLFVDSDETACPASSIIVTSGSWAALTPTERAARRQAYAKQVAVDVEAQASNLADIWQTRFATTLANPGGSNRVFRTEASAVNAVSDALFYLDKQVKDAKLAAPLGRDDEPCSAPPCLERREFVYANLDTQALQQNLLGFRKVMQGCELRSTGHGFISLLEAVGAADLAARLNERIAAADSAFSAATRFDQMLVDKPTEAQALLDRVKGVTDLIKTEMLTVLDLELPTSLEGDND